MDSPPEYTELAAKAGISPSYANEIVRNERSPSIALALHICRATGWKPARIAQLTDEQIEALSAVHPYRPTPAEPQASAAA